MNKILLDATSIPKQPVGAGIYIQHLVREILLLSSNFEFFILAHKNDFCLFNLDRILSGKVSIFTRLWSWIPNFSGTNIFSKDYCQERNRSFSRSPL